MLTITVKSQRFADPVATAPGSVFVDHKEVRTTMLSEASAIKTALRAPRLFISSRNKHS